MVDKIILVDNNTSRISSFQKEVKGTPLANTVTVTLNGGHALLYLDHINHKIKDTKTLILLNIHTPIANGFDFLEGYKEASSLKKENIRIAVMEDNLQEEEIEKIKKLGVTNFFSLKNLFSNIPSMINQYNQGGEKKYIQVSKMQVPQQVKKGRKKTKLKSNDDNSLNNTSK